MADDTPGWLYFGCGLMQPGHYLFYPSRGLAKIGELGRVLSRFDGQLAPLRVGAGAPRYQATFSSLGAFGLVALAWWDNSVDTRPGSNSIVFAPNIGESPEQVLIDAEKRFPWVFERLPQPVTLFGGSAR